MIPSSSHPIRTRLSARGASGNILECSLDIPHRIQFQAGNQSQGFGLCSRIAVIPSLPRPGPLLTRRRR